MSSHRLHHQGLYAWVPAADDFVVLDAGERVTASLGLGVGCLYSVSDQGGPVRVVESIFRGDELLAEDEVLHEPGDGQLVVWTFEEESEAVPGRYRFVVAFPDGSGAEPLVAEIDVVFGPPAPEVDRPVRVTHVGTFRFDPDDGSLEPHTAGGAVSLRDPQVTSFGVRVDVEGGWPAGAKLTTLFSVTPPDGETTTQAAILTGPRVMSWPAADPGPHRIALSFPDRPDAKPLAWRFTVGP